MSYETGFRKGWQQGRAHDQIEYERRSAILRAPTPQNDPRLLERVRCRVLEPFYVRGKAVDRGERIELPRADAESMAALKRVELI